MTRDVRASVVISLAALAVGWASGCAGDPDKTVAREASARPAGQTGVVDLDGRPVDLLRSERGRVAVVIFTRTDCPVSNRLAPEVRQLHERFHPRGADFFLVYVDPDETADAIRQHVRDYQYPLRPLRDPRHELVSLCGATVTPEAAVFGRDHAITYRGRICDQYVALGNAKPAPTVHDLADAVEATLNGAPVAVPRTRAVGCSIADVSPAPVDGSGKP